MKGRVIKFEGSVHAEADRILPWWVNGTLPEDERQQVEQHLAECAQCQHEVAWLRSLQDEYLHQHAEEESTTSMQHRLRHRLNKERRKNSAPLMPHTSWQRHGRKLVWLATAQAALILILGAALLHNRYPAYHTLSAPANDGSLLAVAFNPHITEAQLRELIRANDARIVGGPTEAGAYLLRLPSNRVNQAQKTMRSSPDVIMVENLQAGENP
jgi:anti-sigma factor RsiW